MTLTSPPLKPLVIVPPLDEHSQLPVVELDRERILRPRVRVRVRKDSVKRKNSDCSLGQFKEQMGFGAWNLYHAAVKTELTRTFSQADVDSRSLAYWGYHRDLFVWNTDNLRRIDRSIFDLEDFGRSALAGRFGEAVAYLVMVKNGYVYWDRIGTLWERACRQANTSHPEMTRRVRAMRKALRAARPDMEPDFAFENNARDVALMESKGSFVHPQHDAVTVKGDLSKGLKQLSAWTRFLVPAPSKSFAIGTYFRDASDTNGDPSLIAVVDPPNEAEPDSLAVAYPLDWIRRANYGAWLIGMGLLEAGRALRNGNRLETVEPLLPIVTIANRQFAVAFIQVLFKDHLVKRQRHPFFEFWRLLEWFPPKYLWHDVLMDVGAYGILVFGLDVTILQRIGDCLADPRSSSLLELERADRLTGEAFRLQDFNGSIMPDGSLVGVLSMRELETIQINRFGL